MKRPLLYILLLLVLPVSTMFGQAQINFENGYMVNNGAYIVLNNSNPNAIVQGNGYIIPESEFSMLVWGIGTSTGSYVVPFGDSTLKYLPVTVNINAPGAGNGEIKFSTYHTPTLNSADKPSDVTNMTPFILPGSPSNADNSYNVVDRFYIIDADSGYSTKPSLANITFPYISGTPNTEVGSPNTLVESRLMAQRFNSNSNTWSDWFGEGCTDAISNNVGTVQTGAVPPADFYRSWSLWDNLTPLPVQISGTNPTCSAANSGSATVTVYGGVSPYTYSWAPSGGSSATASGLTAGSYTVSVHDMNGCTSTIAITLTQPPSLSVSATIVSNVTCLNGNNGSVTANVSGGSSPYTYNWSNAATVASISNLTAGSYSVLVTDNSGCTGTTSVTITQPATGMRDSISAIVNVGCNGGNGGIATVGVKDGKNPYTFAWSNGNTTPSASGLSAGTYTITVTTNAGCSSVLTVTITQPSAVRDSVAAISYPACHANTGSATIGVKGGTGAYTYTWTRGVSTTASATGLIAGNYTVTVKDNHGCTSSVLFTITQPGAIRDSVVLAASHSISCKGSTDGTITVGAKYGTAPYTYTWTPNVSSTATASNLSTGTYSITITDANGCTGSLASYTITQPMYILSDSISVLTDVGCFGGTGGVISIGSKGGSSPYTYSWSDGNTKYTQSGLSAGTYTMTITDHHGCSQTLSATVTQPAAALQVTVASKTNPSCHGGTGNVTLNVTGGTPSYSYVWVPNVSTTSSCSSITAGTYTVTVKDIHGCNASVIFTVTQPAAIRDSMVASLKQNVTCRGAQNGSATVGVKYGTGPFTYLWSPNGATTATATGLSAGTYTVTITDANGCTGTAATTTITSPAARLYDSVARQSCSGNVITATLGTIGGTSPYTYLWNPGGGTRQTMSGLAPGTYTISVTDAHGCQYIFAKNLICGGIIEHDGQEDNDSNTVTCCAGLDNINLYPNPNTGQFTLAGLTKGMIIQIFDYTGRIITTTTASDITMQMSLAEQPNGIYLLRIMDKSGTLVSQKKVVKTQ